MKLLSNITLVKAIILFLLSLTTSFATTDISNYDTIKTGIGSFSLTYNPNTSMVTTQFNSKNYDSWWLVATDGAMPSKSVQLIGDVDKNIITAYTYNGGGSQGYKTGEYLGTFKNVITSTGFTLDLSGINAKAQLLGADGFEIGDKAGIWFKGGNYSDLNYKNNKITYYDACEFKTIADYSNKTTTKTPKPVSEPLALLTLMSAMAIYGVKRKAKAKI